MTSCARPSCPPTAIVEDAAVSAGSRAARGGAQGDARQDRRRADQLELAEGVVEGQRAHRPAHQRLEVDERPCELRSHARLPDGEEHEGQEGAREGEREYGAERRGAGHRRRQTFEGQRERQSDERPRSELQSRHRRRVATGEQPRLSDDEGRGAGDGEEDESVARERRLAAAAARDDRHAGQREPEARPGEYPGGSPAEGGGEQGDEHRGGTDDERRVRDARVLDTEVLKDDDEAVAACAPCDDREGERAAQPAPGKQRERQRGEREAHHGQPGRIEPFERPFRERNGETPQQAGGDQSGDSGVAMGHVHIVSQNTRYPSRV